MSVSSWHLPMAIATRPQFGSAPWTAVLTSGELTIALATRLAWARSRAPSTTTSISVSAPSPSRAICLVSDSATAPSAASSSSPSTGPAAPLASTTAVSLVDVSVSMLTQLNVRSTTRRKRGVELVRVDVGVGQQHGDHRRHVGLDHPDALGDADDAAPVRRRPSPRPPWRTVSVVMIPAPRPRRRCPAGRGRHAATPARIRSIG